LNLPGIQLDQACLDIDVFQLERNYRPIVSARQYCEGD